MTWRSVIISNPGHLSLAQNRLVIKQDSEPVSVPLEDIAVILLDCRELQLTAPLLSECASRGVALIVTDPTHLPSGALLPLLSHSRAFGVLRQQLALKKPLRKRIWQVIVKQKILNQAACVGDSAERHRLTRLAVEVKSGDPDNREAVAASVYFKAMFGDKYLRRENNTVTAAQNYGYAILRSALGRALVMHGLLPALGIHHDNERNAFNLSDDLIEPFRPIVDREICSWSVDLEDLDQENINVSLSSKEKQKMVGILHTDISDTAAVEGEQRTVLNQIEQTVVSLVRVIKARDPRLLVLPEFDGQTG